MEKLSICLIALLVARISCVEQSTPSAPAVQDLDNSESSGSYAVAQSYDNNNSGDSYAPSYESQGSTYEQSSGNGYQSNGYSNGKSANPKKTVILAIPVKLALQLPEKNQQQNNYGGQSSGNYGGQQTIVISPPSSSYGSQNNYQAGKASASYQPSKYLSKEPEKYESNYEEKSYEKPSYDKPSYEKPQYEKATYEKSYEKPATYFKESKKPYGSSYDADQDEWQSGYAAEKPYSEEYSSSPYTDAVEHSSGYESDTPSLSSLSGSSYPSSLELASLYDKPSAYPSSSPYTAAFAGSSYSGPSFGGPRYPVHPSPAFAPSPIYGKPTSYPPSKYPLPSYPHGPSYSPSSSSSFDLLKGFESLGKYSSSLFGSSYSSGSSPSKMYLRPQNKGIFGSGLTHPFKFPLRPSLPYKSYSSSLDDYFGQPSNIMSSAKFARPLFGDSKSPSSPSSSFSFLRRLI